MKVYLDLFVPCFLSTTFLINSDCETEFLYPDLPESATTQPYMFEPVPQPQHSEDAAAGGPSRSDQEESEDEDTNIDRIGHKEW